MTDSKSTKAELIEELERVRELARGAETRAYAAEKQIPKVNPVPEIEAMAGCVRALDKFIADEKAGRSSFGASPTPGAMSRILGYLTDRYQKPSY